MATKPSKLTTELINLEAESDAFDAAAAYDRSRTALSNVMLEREEANQQAHLTSARQRECYDFQHGYFDLNDQIYDESVSQLLTNLRVYERFAPRGNITLELNTPGGAIVHGFRLVDELNRLRMNKHRVTIRVRGMAASMGGVILQAADRRIIGPSAYILIHRAAFGAIGKAYEVEDELEFTKMMELRIANIFSERSGTPVKKFTDLFAKRKDVWIDAEEALKLGLVDEIG